MSFALAQTSYFFCFCCLVSSRLCGHNSPYKRWTWSASSEWQQSFIIKRLYLHTQRRLTGTPYSSFTYQRNPSDPIINPSPISWGWLFHRAPTIFCLKLALSLHTQAILNRVSHRSSLRVELPRPNLVLYFFISINSEPCSNQSIISL